MRSSFSSTIPIFLPRRGFSLIDGATICNLRIFSLGLDRQGAGFSSFMVVPQFDTILGELSLTHGYLVDVVAEEDGFGGHVLCYYYLLGYSDDGIMFQSIYNDKPIRIVIIQD